MAKKDNGIIRRVEDIDEKELLESIAGMPSKEKPPAIQPIEVKEYQEPEEAQPEVEESISIEVPTNKRRTTDYKAVFLNPRELSARKCVYISMEIHEKIVKIVSQIAEKGVSVGVYVDTVLKQHLETNKNEINALYRKRKDDLI